MALQLARKPWLKDAAASFGRSLLYPPVLLYFLLALTMPLWRFKVLYLLVETRLFDPNGIIQWSIAIAGGLCCLGGFGFFLFSTLRRSAPLAQARRCKRSGDVDGYQHWKTVIRSQSRRTMLPLWIGALMVFPLVLAPVAIILGDGGPILVKDHGKLRYGTRLERVHSSLRTILER